MNCQTSHSYAVSQTGIRLSQETRTCCSYTGLTAGSCRKDFSHISLNMWRNCADKAAGYQEWLRRCSDSAKSEASACAGVWGHSSPGTEEHLPWLSFIRFLSAYFSNLSVVAIQRDTMMLPDEKSSAPGELTPCLFFKNPGLWNCTISILQGELDSNQPMCQLLPVHPAVRYHFGVNYQRPPKRSPGQKNMPIKGWGSMLIISGKLLLCVCLFWKINEYACKIEYLTRSFSLFSTQNISEDISAHSSSIE